jgi:hypothetical protein
MSIPRTHDADALLTRLQRTAALCCLAMMIVAVVVAHGRLRPAFGVLGGGILTGVSLVGIRSGVGNVLSQSADGERQRAWWILLKVTGRYALLALLAYVMIARLRLHPLGLLAGASSVVAAAAIEAGRLLSKKQ